LLVYKKDIQPAPDDLFTLQVVRVRSRGTSKHCVGEQKNNYLLTNAKLNVIFALLHRCSE